MRGKQRPRGISEEKENRTTRWAKGTFQGPWVPVRPEWLSRLAGPSTLGGQINFRYGVPRDRGGWRGVSSPCLAFLLP